MLWCPFYPRYVMVPLLPPLCYGAPSTPVMLWCPFYPRGRNSLCITILCANCYFIFKTAVCLIITIGYYHLRSEISVPDRGWALPMSNGSVMVDHKIVSDHEKCAIFVIATLVQSLLIVTAFYFYLLKTVKLARRIHSGRVTS
jgi:hypothetical protein